MNATSSGREAKDSDDTISPVAVGKRNAGIDVPRANIVDGVAVMVESPVYMAVNQMARVEAPGSA